MGDFNARIHRRFPLESGHIGDFIFGEPTAHFNADSNRNSLLELCVCHGHAIAKTFFEHDPDHQVTCYNVGSRPSDPLLPRHFGQIECYARGIFCRAWWTWRAAQKRPCLRSIFYCIASSRFPWQRSARPGGRGWTTQPWTTSPWLRTSATASRSTWPRAARHDNITEAFPHAAADCLPALPAVRRRPWIGDRTLQLLSLSGEARSDEDFVREKY